MYFVLVMQVIDSNEHIQSHMKLAQHLPDICHRYHLLADNNRLSGILYTIIPRMGIGQSMYTHIAKFSRHWLAKRRLKYIVVGAGGPCLPFSTTGPQ